MVDPTPGFSRASATLSSFILLELNFMKFWILERRGTSLICRVSERLDPRAESSSARLMYSPLASGSTGISLLVVAERGVGVTVGSKGDSRGVRVE